MMEYKVVEAHSVEELMHLVQEMIYQAWTLQGGMTADNGMFYQAMTR